MNDVIINGTNKLPTVNLDAYNGIIEVSGRSIPEDGKEFYDEILKWVSEYQQNPKTKTTAIFAFEYLNSSSHISVKSLIMALEKIRQKNSEVLIKWYYEIEDSSMHEIALDYQEICKHLDFEIIAVDSF